MRNILLTILCCFPILGFAQGLNPNQIVQWKFSIHPTSPTTVTFSAEANIGPNFHIFHTDAGGDGTLINTEFTFDNAHEDENTPWQSTPQPVVKQFDVIEGDVYWHEKNVVFTQTI